MEGIAEGPLPPPRLDSVLQDKVYPDAEQFRYQPASEAGAPDSLLS
jgi:hypothetical protein